MLTREGTRLPFTLGDVDVLTAQVFDVIANDQLRNYSLGKYTHKHGLYIFTLEKVCAITTEIQEKIRGLVKLTTFKCRKSGYLYPNAVRLMYQELFITMNFSHNHATILKAQKAHGVTD